MVKITEFKCFGLSDDGITDEPPRFEYLCDGEVSHAQITAAGSVLDVTGKLYCEFTGELKPFTTYKAELKVSGKDGSEDSREIMFETGRLDEAWRAKWITDGAYKFKEKRVSPKPMTFHKSFSVHGKVARARLYATALGVYEIELNGSKVGDRYFAPGFTSYKHTLRYQAYDVTEALSAEGNELFFEVAGGWAVGSYVFSRRNRVTAPRQALLAELRIEYEDGTSEVIATDESWGVTTNGRVIAADLYDGEIYDARRGLSELEYRPAAVEKVKIAPRIIADVGPFVKRFESFEPVSVTERGDELIYKFPRNFAGVVRLKINGKDGQKITVRHAEVLNRDGSLNTAILRTAKATIEYTCKDGEQEYSPRFTYMGFQYVSVRGISRENVSVSAQAIYSDIPLIGEFECSEPMLNKLNENIIWSAKSNFVEIPTDCPQRDERMGWTGDIAMFAPTACFDFDTSAFLNKWLNDMRDEQLKTGGFHCTVPAQGYGFPTTMPAMAIDFWGDACILVPYAEYLVRGDITTLEKMYPSMKKYVKACKFWAGFGVGKYRYIWHTPHSLHYGDWVSPDVPKMSQWQKRSKWTATASLYNCASKLSEIADILGYANDSARYKKLAGKVKNAYEKVFTDGNGKLKNEFQTGYVLPLAFGMFSGDARENAAANLNRMVEQNGYRIATGIPATPFVLSALADNGYVDTAYKMLKCTDCPSWLYEVKAGATTLWERWDGLNENGECDMADDGIAGGMVSYNHYVFGSVGNFLYRRVLGIESVTSGYKKFTVKPILGGDIRYAKGGTRTPYGRIFVDWKTDGERFDISVTVPQNTECKLVTPDGATRMLGGGNHKFSCVIMDSK